MKHTGYKITEQNGQKRVRIGYANTEEELAEKGYLPVEKTERPNDGKKYRPVYTEVDGVIRQTWEVFVPISEGVSE